MRIQVNSDQNVKVDTRVIQFVHNEVNRILKPFVGKLSRAEVHLSDVNSYRFDTSKPFSAVWKAGAKTRLLRSAAGPPSDAAARPAYFG